MTPRGLGDVVTVAAIVLLVGAVYLLPPDTSLKRVREGGTLRVCVPDEYPPLVTNEPDRPGADVEILDEIADRLGLRLQLVRKDAIGRDFNPRNWRITRAQCAVVAGGVVTTGITRSFMETTPPHLETGWAAVAASTAASASLEGARVGFVPGNSGLDRIALSTFLRRAGASTTLLPDARAGLAAIEDDRVDVLVTEHLLATRLASQEDLHVQPLAGDLARYPLGFGLWKGDLTLKRALVSALEDLERDGTLRTILGRYGLEPEE